MSRRTTKIIFVFVIIAIIIAAGLGIYFFHSRGPIVGKISFGTKYILTELRTTERFAGATISEEEDGYFEINHDKQTGNLYLVGLTASSTPIPFIVTSYKESNKETVIEFEYILNNGEDTTIQRLRAISDDQRICIRAVETHGVQSIISQDPDKTESLDYNVDILIFTKENQ